MRQRVALIALLLLTNPLLYAWATTSGGLFPDSIAYLELARVLADGQVFLSGFRHVDAALVLPPAFPALIAAGAAVTGDPLLASQWLAGASLLLSTVPLFLWLERAGNPWLAAAALELAQWQPWYFQFGTSTLTEGPFILAVACCGALACRVASAGCPLLRDAFGLGVALAAAFLTRHIGIFLLPCVLLALALAWRIGPDVARADRRRASAAVIAGFGLLVLPYGAVLQAQTGYWPWTTQFRLGHYVVTGSAAAAEAGANADIYAVRRQQRRLNAEGTEMLGQVVAPAAIERAGGRAILQRTGPNLVDNLGHAVAALGLPALALALIGGLAALRRPAASDPGARETASARLLLAGCVGGYYLAISILTGLVARYIEVSLPFVLGLAVVTLHAILTAGTAHRVMWRRATVVGLLGLSVAAVPRGEAAPRQPKFGMHPNPFGDCAGRLAPGTPVFALDGSLAFLLGGSQRIVPNDGLNRIARYGRLTGVNWLAHRASAMSRHEAGYYEAAGWIADPSILARHPDFRLHCVSPDGSAGLFEIVSTAAADP